MYVLFAAYGFAANPLYAVAVAHANDFARDGDFAKIAGGMLLILGIGLAIGPALASVLMNVFGPVALFMVTVVFHAALAVTAWLRMRVRKSVDAADREPFQPMQSDRPTTLESVVLDPRADPEPDETEAEPEVEEALSDVTEAGPQQPETEGESDVQGRT
jgi:MFS family permease